MFYKSTTALATAGLLLSAAASASEDSIEMYTFDNLPEEGHVILTGHIDQIENPREFTLRDPSGATIDIDSATDIPFREGDKVTVVGTMDDVFLGFGKEVDATSVTLKGKAGAMEDVDPVATVAVKPATSEADIFYRIDDLPDDGPVTLIGTVTDMDYDDNTFRVRGQSGETIDIHSPELMQVKTGQKVSVDGQMNDEVAGIIGEEIVAAKVTIIE